MSADTTRMSIATATNEPAIAFYRRMRAQVLPDGPICRLTDAGIDKRAGRE